MRPTTCFPTPRYPPPPRTQQFHQMEAGHALHVPMTGLVVSETFSHLDAVDVVCKASSPFKSAAVPEPDGFFANAVVER